MLTGHFGLQLVASTSSSQFFIVLGRAFRSLGFLGWAAWYSLVASMMRRKCSGPLVQVKGVGFWLYFFRCRSSKDALRQCLLGENAEKAFGRANTRDRRVGRREAGGYHELVRGTLRYIDVIRAHATRNR